MAHGGVIVIDPGKLADAAAMHERAARDRLTFKSSSYIVPDGPMAAATRAQVDAALGEVREAFVAGTRFAESIQAAKPSEAFLRMEQAAVDRERMKPKAKRSPKTKPKTKTRKR